MNSESNAVWLGYAPLGERVCLDPVEMRRGTVVLGKGSEELTLLIASSLVGVGSQVVFLDLSGRAAKELSGYMKAVDASRVMHDAFKVDEEESQYHGQLIASALTTLFNLPANQESILSSALSAIAAENGFASPSAIFDASTLVSGHKATDKQEVEGRLASLQMLSATAEGEALADVCKASVIIGFGNAISQEVGEAAAAFVISKLLALVRRGTVSTDVLVVSEAHRLFRLQRFVHHSRRFQNAVLSSQSGTILVSELDKELDEQLAGSCPLRLLSSSVWNVNEKDKLLDDSFVLQDTVRGTSVPLAPRRFEPLAGEVVHGGPSRGAPSSLTLEILEAINSNELATKASIAAWLSAEYGRDSVIVEVDRLTRELFVTPSVPPRGMDVSMTVLHLTLLGEQEMKRLRENG